MSWERRGPFGHRYYYRARKIKGKVIKQCFGRGVSAKRAAREDARRRSAREAERQAILAEMAKIRAVSTLMADLEAETQVIFEARMLAQGFHRVNYGPWRRRRE